MGSMGQPLNIVDISGLRVIQTYSGKEYTELEYQPDHMHWIKKPAKWYGWEESSEIFKPMDDDHTQWMSHRILPLHHGLILFKDGWSEGVNP